jgi:hypothetical protein
VKKWRSIPRVEDIAEGLTFSVFLLIQMKNMHFSMCLNNMQVVCVLFLLLIYTC